LFLLLFFYAQAWFTTNGAFATDITTAIHPTNCSTLGIGHTEDSELVSIYPNPFKSTINIQINNIATMTNAEVLIYNIIGQLMF